MLVKLTPDQVASHWGELKPAIEVALPPIASGKVEGRMNNILATLLADNMQCWVFRRDGIILGVGTTIIREDMGSGGKDLLLYTLYAMPGATQEDWILAFETIRKWAHVQGCERYVGYTQNPEMVRLLEKFGAEFWTYATVNFVHPMDKGGE